MDSNNGLRGQLTNHDQACFSLDVLLQFLTDFLAFFHRAFVGEFFFFLKEGKCRLSVWFRKKSFPISFIYEEGVKSERNHNTEDRSWLFGGKYASKIRYFEAMCC